MASEYLKWKYKDVKPDEKPVYTKKELRRNWWDYNLIWVIVGIVGALILFFIIKDMFFRTKPDYEVALIAANAPEEETGRWRWSCTSTMWTSAIPTRITATWSGGRP